MPSTGPWNYILVFSDSVGTADAVKDFIDSRAEVTTWYRCMTNAIFIRSELSATQLGVLFRRFSPEKGRFIVLDCSTDKNGWLPPEAWKFMKGDYP